MKRPALVLAIGVMLLVLAGPTALGRLALWTDAPGLALGLLTDPAARGLALWRRGDVGGADAAFAEAGRSQTFNRGLTLAGRGEYPLAVAYFDAVLFANPADAEARRLRDLVATLFAPVRGDSIAPGRLAGHGGGPSAKVPGVVRAGAPDPEWQKGVEARGIAATDDWLTTVADDPGEFLRIRLRAEHDRRAAQGMIRPEEAVTW